jgi:AraC-like DNA-binding protein
LQRGELLLIPPGEEHTFSCDTSSGAIISCIHFSVVPHIVLPAQKFWVSPDPEILHLFIKCAQEFGRKEDESARLLNQAVNEIWIRIIRLSGKSTVAAEPIKLKMAKAFLADHYREKVTRIDAARHLGITPEHLNFLFKKHGQTTPGNYLLGVRIDRARALLPEAGMNVSQVAFAVGFEDPLYFSRVFKKTTGVSPKKCAQRL